MKMFYPFSSLKEAVQKIFSAMINFYENDLYITDYLKFMDDLSCVEKSGNKNFNIKEFANIEFRNVSYKYPNTNYDALNNVSFTIRKGEKIAIIGSNGAGKTTIIKLLLKLYKPTEGQILINGIPIESYNTQSIRKAMAVLFQDYTVYPFSIEDNIALGKTYDEQHIWRVLDQVELKDKINAFPKKLKTPITSQLSEKGVELSGGEGQRLAIARIYARDSAFTILDEPTSNLDPKIENKLYESLFSDDKEYTLMIISHRLNFTYKMDKIICMDGGKLIEIGTHEHLINKKGFYKKMYNLNTAKYDFNSKKIIM